MIKEFTRFFDYLLINLIFLVILSSCTINSIKFDTNKIYKDVKDIKQVNDNYSDYEDEFEDSYESEPVAIYDPLESFNRKCFKFNDKFYFWVLKPAASNYGYYVPEPIRLSIRNFFFNIETPIRAANSILQIKPYFCFSEISRFTINTTIGFLGFFDSASKLTNLKPANEDFGQTMGKYKIGNGMYIVFPFLGPSSIRDFTGSFVDAFLDPISYIDSFAIGAGIKSIDIINKTSLKIGEYESLKQAAFEPYDALKDGYVQMRNKMISE